MAYAGLACQWALAAVFCRAVLAKVRTRAEAAGFASSLVAMGVVGRPRAGTLAATIVAVESIVVVLLVAPMTVPAGLVLAGLTCLAFALAIRRSVRRGARVPCRCFGASTTPLGPAHVLRNVVLTAVASFGLLARALASSGPSDVAGAAVALLAATVLVLLVWYFDEFVGAFTGAPSTARQRARTERRL